MLSPSASLPLSSAQEHSAPDSRPSSESLPPASHEVSPPPQTPASREISPPPQVSSSNRASPSPQASSSTQAEKMTILLASDDFDRVFLAFMLATSARAMDVEVNIFFALWGLNLLRRHKDQASFAELRPETDQEKQKKSLLAKMMAMMMPCGPHQTGLSKMNFGGLGAGMMRSMMEKAKAPSLPDLMDMAIENGVRFTVCSLTMEIMGFQNDDLLALPNLGVGGITSCLGNALQSKLFFVV